MSSTIKINNLNYKDLLKNINVEFTENNIYAILGKNASGKSLLLKSIAHLISYTGNIFINNTASINYSDLGIFLEDYNFFEGTVLDCLKHPLLNLGYSEKKAKSKIFEVSKNLNLDSILYFDLNMLSLSQKKLVYFARSIIHEPSIIILDDIFDGLDKKNRDKILNTLKKLKKSIVIYTTRNSENINISDYTLILNGGELIIFDDTKNVLLEEKNFTKNNLKIPFFLELSNKLKSYGLIGEIYFDTNEMVDAIWK